MPAADSVSLDDVGDGPVAGTVGGAAFSAADVRFRVIPRSGRHRVDLFFADRAIERCGLALEREDRRVWLRFPDRIRLEPGAYALDGESEGDFELHYEYPDDSHVVSIHRGVAQLEIREVTSTRVTGALSVCFADASRSCVEGTFEASPCLSRVDGRALREPPGLSDEAIDAVNAVGTGAE
jgi:hypothetical protein